MNIFSKMIQFSISNISILLFSLVPHKILNEKVQASVIDYLTIKCVFVSMSMLECVCDCECAVCVCVLPL